MAAGAGGAGNGGAGNGGAGNGGAGNGGAGNGGAGNGGAAAVGGAGGCSTGVSCPGAGGALVCVDTSSDAANCGSCGMQCINESVCVLGECACGGQMPSVCAGHCKDLASDASNCGSCGTTCLAGVPCQDGACACPPAQLCGGACVDLETNPSHCGACGVVCGASAVCAEGACHALVTLDVDAGGGGGECQLALDGTSAFWWSDQAIRRAPKAGGAAAVLATSQTRGFTLDSTHVFWTTYGGGTVMRVPKDGSGAAETLAGGLSAPSQIATDGTNVYWLDVEGLLKMKNAVGALPSLFSADSYVHSGIGIDADNLYWMNGSFQIVSRAKAGGLLTGLATADGIPKPLVVDAGVIYFGSDSFEGGLWKVSVGGGDLTQLAAASAGVGVDADSVYFAKDGAVMKLAKGGGKPVKLAATAGGGFGGFCVAADSTHVFWIEQNKLVRYTK
jgi:hypothetical protein